MMEYELEEVERDFIEFRKELGEYNIDIIKTSLSLAIPDAIPSFS
jgi:hypothetical protein